MARKNRAQIRLQWLKRVQSIADDLVSASAPRDYLDRIVERLTEGEDPTEEAVAEAIRAAGLPEAEEE